MARGKRKVAERDYEKLISSTKECIEKLEIKSVEIKEELKSKKDELKKLEKDFKSYKIQKAEEEKRQQTQELAKLLMESGLSLDEIKEKLDKSVSLVLVDARGLTVGEDTDLRKQLREAGVDYKVYKNTMINFAIQGTQFEGLSQYLEGPTAAVFSYDEATKGASIIKKVSETAKKLEFKAGVIEGIVYDAEGMKAIADIPSREVLISKLLGSFKSPISTFARVINQIAEKKGEGEAAAE